METPYEKLTKDQLEIRITYLRNQLVAFQDELSVRRQELVDLTAPFKEGNIIEVEATRWSGQLRGWESYIQTWIIDNVLPPRYSFDGDFRLRGRRVKKDGTIGANTHDIPASAKVIAATYEDYLNDRAA